MTSLRKSYKLHIGLLRAAIPAVLALLLPLLGGCSADEPSDITPPSSGSDGNLHLSFRMNTDAGRASTRTDDQGHPEEDAELPLEEAFNTRDFAFYIFAEGNDEASRGDGARLLYANFDIHNTTDPYTMITGAGGQYNVTVTLPARTLAAILGHELQPDSDNPVRFRMILLANSTAGLTDEMAGGEGWGSSGVERYRTGIPHAAGATTFGDVIQAAESFRFSYSDMHEDSPDSYGATVDGVVKGTIPMFGSISAQASERQLLASRPYERIYFGEVFMLRSLAKLRVRDAIREKSADGFPRLHSARLVYEVPDAYMVPAGASEYVNGSQVHTMRVCNPAEGTPPAVTSHNLPFISLPTLSSAFRGTLLSYIPEQAITTGRPVLELRVQTRPFTDIYGLPTNSYQPTDNSQLADCTRLYTIPLAGYNGQGFTWGDKILRNHIYDLNVDYLEGIGLTLKASVADWTLNRFELDFMDNPSASVATWTGAGTGTDLTKGQIYVRPWDSEGNREPVSCTFTVSTPLNATWTAYLVSTGGDPGAFRFKTGTDASGAALTAETVSGSTGSPQALEIVSVNPHPAVNSSAILQIVVAMDGGTRFMEARITDSSFKNWTINQSRQ